MSTVVQCPRCHADIDITPDLVDQPIRCACGHTFSPHSTAIQAGAPRRKADDYDEPMPSPRRPTARAAFPWGPIAIVTIGILFLLLAFSVGFNVWVITTPDQNHFRMAEVRDAELMAMEQRARAEEAREQALLAEREAQRKLQLLDRELANARKRLDDANHELANRVDEKDVEWGELEGHVTWKGELPKVESIEKLIRTHADAKHALNAPPEQLLNPTWCIDPKSRGVANVVVFLKRPKDGNLPIHADDKARKMPVFMDAPFMILVPHVIAVYPEWFDGTARGKTGAQFIIKNSSTANLCPLLTSGKEHGNLSLVIAPGKQEEVKLSHQDQPVRIDCLVHPWQLGYSWIFDHPYFAITKSDGTFTIPRVPAGMDVQVMAWHEAQGWLFTKNGKTMNLKAGKNTLDFEMSAK